MDYKMKNIIKIFVLFLIIAQVFVCSVAHTQEKFHEYFTGPEDRKEHRIFYGNYAKEILGIASEDIISNAYFDRINITKESEFREIGIEVTQIMHADFNCNYCKRALLSPLIVEGVVFKRDYCSEAKLDLEYHVAVTETHFDELGFCLDTLKIKTYSSYVDSPRYFSGEKVILYLEPLSFGTKKFLSLMKNEDEINNFFRKTYNISFSEINQYALCSKKFKIIDGYVFDDRKNIGPRSDFINQLKSLLEINNKEDFYKIHKE